MEAIKSMQKSASETASDLKTQAEFTFPFIQLFKCYVRGREKPFDNRHFFGDYEGDSDEENQPKRNRTGEEKRADEKSTGDLPDPPPPPHPRAKKVIPPLSDTEADDEVEEKVDEIEKKADKAEDDSAEEEANLNYSAPPPPNFEKKIVITIDDTEKSYGDDDVQIITRDTMTATVEETKQGKDYAREVNIRTSNAHAPMNPKSKPAGKKRKRAAARGKSRKVPKETHEEKKGAPIQPRQTVTPKKNVDPVEFVPDRKHLPPARAAAPRAPLWSTSIACLVCWEKFDILDGSGFNGGDFREGVRCTATLRLHTAEWHFVCHECIARTAEARRQPPLPCVNPECKGAYLDTHLMTKISSDVHERWTRLEVEQFATAAALWTCKGCTTTVELVGDALYLVDCPVCKKSFCRKCKALCHEGSTCEELAEEKKKRPFDGVDQQTAEALLRLDAAKCPRCDYVCFRANQCNDVQCGNPKCGVRFCGVCKEETNVRNHHWCRTFPSSPISCTKIGCRHCPNKPENPSEEHDFDMAPLKDGSVPRRTIKPIAPALPLRPVNSGVNSGLIWGATRDTPVSYVWEQAARDLPAQSERERQRLDVAHEVVAQRGVTIRPVNMTEQDFAAVQQIMNL